jgi:DNA-binding transcriptional LysR family regulator
VHLVSGWSDIGDSIRQLRLRHRQRVKCFANQLDLTRLGHHVPGEQMDWTAEQFPIQVIYPQNRHLSAKVRIFVDWVSELIQRDPILQTR